MDVTRHGHDILDAVNLISGKLVRTVGMVLLDYMVPIAFGAAVLGRRSHEFLEITGALEMPASLRLRQWPAQAARRGNRSRCCTGMFKAQSREMGRREFGSLGNCMACDLGNFTFRNCPRGKVRDGLEALYRCTLRACEGFPIVQNQRVDCGLTVRAGTFDGRTRRAHHPLAPRFARDRRCRCLNWRCRSMLRGFIVTG